MLFRMAANAKRRMAGFSSRLLPRLCVCGLPQKALGDGAPASRFLPSPQPAYSAGGALPWQHTSTSVNDLKPHFSERRVKILCRFLLEAHWNRVSNFKLN